jgi:uncharacterized protein YifN (PemK superfamily)
MKKKIFTMLALSFIIGGVVSASTMHYYSDLLYSQKSRMSEELGEKYTERMDEIKFQVHNDMVMFVETERLRVEKEAEEYLHQKLNTEQTMLMQEHSSKIQQTADDLLQELKSEIDELVGTETKG